MEIGFKSSFNEDPGFLYFKAVDFAHAAFRLKEIADNGDKVWKQEMRKLNLKSGEVKKVKPTLRRQVAEMDRRCRSISIYLLAHSLELLIKILHHDKFGKIEYHHKISKLFNKIKERYDFSGFNTTQLKELFIKLDELLIWAGRYTSPRKRKDSFNVNKVKIFSSIETPDGYRAYTNNVVMAVEGIKGGNGTKLLESVHKYILKNTKFHKMNFEKKIDQHLKNKRGLRYIFGIVINKVKKFISSKII